MPTLPTIGVFALASLALAVVPGPAVTYIVTQSMFFLAFLPQFVDPDRGAVWAQVAMLGCLFSLIAFASDATYAVLADALAGRLRRSERATRVRRFASGGIFVALGVSAAAAHRS